MKILYFSTVNWKWIKQRPHFLAQGLADKGIQIEYLSLTPFFKQKKEKKKVIGKNLLINDKYVIPYASKIPIIEYINTKYIGQVLNKKYDVIIITHPLQYKYLIKALGYNPKVIYECMDNMPYFYTGDYQKKIIELEEQICNRVDKIIASSYYIEQKIIEQYHVQSAKIKVISNGVDGRFTESLSTTLPKQLNLKKRNLVYIGTIGEWLELELLNKYAKKNRQDNIYLIGPIEIKIPNDIASNICFMGKVDHKYVANIINQAEILIIPFKVNELIRGVDPVKIYEYKAFNKPIVSSYWKELERHQIDYNIYFYSDVVNFEDAIKSIRKNKEINLGCINRKYIEQNSWYKRVEEYMSIINIR